MVTVKFTGAPNSVRLVLQPYLSVVSNIRRWAGQVQTQTEDIFI